MPPINGAVKNGAAAQEEGDNSSSGVSSDQENERKKIEAKQSGVTTVIIGGNTDRKSALPLAAKFEQKKFMEELHANTEKIINGGGLKKAQISITSTPVTTKVTNSIVTRMIGTSEPPKRAGVTPPAPKKKIEFQNASSVEERSESDDDDSPSPPSIGFQRHNSLTRKQAATIAAQRARQMQHTIKTVSLARLPPPIEHHDDYPSGEAAAVVLAPPPEFCDIVSSGGGTSSTIKKAPKEHAKFKANRLHSQ